MFAVDPFVIDDDFHMRRARCCVAELKERLLIAQIGANTEGHIAIPNASYITFRLTNPATRS